MELTKEGSRSLDVLRRLCGGIVSLVELTLDEAITIS
jgi:hypothetical protein